MHTEILCEYVFPFLMDQYLVVDIGPGCHVQRTLHIRKLTSVREGSTTVSRQAVWTEGTWHYDDWCTRLLQSLVFRQWLIQAAGSVSTCPHMVQATAPPMGALGTAGSGSTVDFPSPTLNDCQPWLPGTRLC